jgi:hypothetical protein
MKPVHANGAKTRTGRRAGPGHDGVARRKSVAPAVVAATYDEFKQFEGQRYTGMRVGRTHKWYYDRGEWREKKVTPDLWQISYAVKKRRAGQAPDGSGVPVGTDYHWLILAHQNVERLDANVYDTSLTGMKFKVAHRRAGAEKWSAGEKARRRRMIKFLEQMIRELKDQDKEATTVAKKPTAKRARKPVAG